MSSGSKLISAVAPVTLTEPMAISVDVPATRNTNDFGVKLPQKDVPSLFPNKELTSSFMVNVAETGLPTLTEMTFEDKSEPMK